jgi:hypothetical protein
LIVLVRTEGLEPSPGYPLRILRVAQKRDFSNKYGVSRNLVAPLSHFVGTVMAIRQRTWSWKGRERVAWVVDYCDAKGKRRLKTFRTKRAALDWNAGTRIDLKHGTHVADADSITIQAAGHLWLASCKTSGLERSTREQYRQHLELHIAPLVGVTKLNKLTLPAVRAFQHRLRENGRSPELTRKVLTSLGSLVADAQERGLTTRNPVASVSAAARLLRATRSSWLLGWTYRPQARSESC